jgi:hypothetical protein
VEVGRNWYGLHFGLPRTLAWYDSIWVIVDRLTKVAHFIPVRTNYTGAKLAELYMAQIVCLHGESKKIVSDRGSQFTSRFWQKLQECLDTLLNFSSAYHPQTDGQTERTNQVLEDMLRAYALKHGDSWDKSLPYAEFSYNNSYKVSLKMSRLRLYMVENAGLLCIRIKLVKKVLWARNDSRGKRTSTVDKGELENCTVETEELCEYPEKIVRV